MEITFAEKDLKRRHESTEEEKYALGSLLTRCNPFSHQPPEDVGPPPMKDVVEEIELQEEEDWHKLVEMIEKDDGGLDPELLEANQEEK